MRHLRELLEVAVTYPEYFVPGRHRERLRDAWPDVKPQFDFFVFTTDQREELEKVGLVGPALLFELGVFNHARDELLDHAEELFPRRHVSDIPARFREPEKKSEGWLTRLRRLFVRTSKVGDVILGSLGKIPVFGMPAEAIKQYKESIEQGVEMARDLVEP